jgi:hypothetical protein
MPHRETPPGLGLKESQRPAGACPGPHPLAPPARLQRPCRPIPLLERMPYRHRCRHRCRRRYPPGAAAAAAAAAVASQVDASARSPAWRRGGGGRVDLAAAPTLSCSDSGPSLHHSPTCRSFGPSQRESLWPLLLAPRGCATLGFGAAQPPSNLANALLSTPLRPHRLLPPNAAPPC